MEINKIAIIGAGTMGNGIAHVFAQFEHKVTLIDVDNDRLNIAIKNITTNLDRQIKKGLITEDIKKKTIDNITLSTKINKLDVNTELIIEAISENKESKLALFKQLHNIVNKNSIFATNTSSISITELATNCRPDKFIGMHFMNPVPVMKLVEVIRGFSTSDNTCNMIVELSKKIDKIPVVVNDYPGFISNRILMPMINEAVFALYEGVAKTEDIDNIMKLGMNHPMGPLTLADFIGLDVCLNIMEILYNGYNDDKYRPCPLLKKMVASGNLGRKTGLGFYSYNK